MKEQRTTEQSMDATSKRKTCGRVAQGQSVSGDPAQKFSSLKGLKVKKLKDVKDRLKELARMVWKATDLIRHPEETTDWVWKLGKWYPPTGSKGPIEGWQLGFDGPVVMDHKVEPYDEEVREIYANGKVTWSSGSPIIVTVLIGKSPIARALSRLHVTAFVAGLGCKERNGKRVVDKKPAEPLREGQWMSCAWSKQSLMDQLHLLNCPEELLQEYDDVLQDGWVLVIAPDGFTAKRITTNKGDVK